MFNNKVPAMVAAVLAASTLSACGGSGGGDNGNGGGNVPPPTITVSSTTVDVFEAGESIIEFDLVDAGDAAIVSATSDSDVVSLDIKTKNQLIITAKTVGNDTPVTVSLEVKYGGQSSTTDISLNVINTSIAPVYEEIDAFISLMEAPYQDEQQLFDYALQVGYLSGITSHSRVEYFNARFSESLESIGGEVVIAESVSSLLDGYSNGTIDEPTLITEFSELVNTYNAKAEASDKVISAVFEEVGMVFSKMELTEYTYYPALSRFSKIPFNDIGVFTDEFQFNAEFSFLEDALPSFNSNQQCLITEEGA